MAENCDQEIQFRMDKGQSLRTLAWKIIFQTEGITFLSVALFPPDLFRELSQTGVSLSHSFEIPEFTCATVRPGHVRLLLAFGNSVILLLLVLFSSEAKSTQQLTSRTSEQVTFTRASIQDHGKI